MYFQNLEKTGNSGDPEIREKIHRWVHFNKCIFRWECFGGIYFPGKKKGLFSYDRIDGRLYDVKKSYNFFFSKNTKTQIRHTTSRFRIFGDFGDSADHISVF